ncbi:MAG: oxaloacetate decarboxylase subunit alpha, partial [Clostridia bacterium]|nr:oxaloacetate decarboxylase subunit alpha [Clostridia bacterium]
KIDPDFVKKIIGDEKQITCRPADEIKPELETLKAKLGAKAQQEEDVLSYALFDQVALKFFEKRDEGVAVANAIANASAKKYNVNVREVK